MVVKGNSSKRKEAITEKIWNIRNEERTMEDIDIQKNIIDYPSLWWLKARILVFSDVILSVGRGNI